ncbi:hypothetical protein ABEB36_015836 [Hypothenemus hampei]|uniref:Uncharacterized protein n=1 Tax=Hypothenemus hampei TaxID=57062 RepID=A0ABD1DYX6_HYPHA
MAAASARICPLSSVMGENHSAALALKSPRINASLLPCETRLGSLATIRSASTSSAASSAISCAPYARPTFTCSTVSFKSILLVIAYGPTPEVRCRHPRDAHPALAVDVEIRVPATVHQEKLGSKIR